MLRKFWRNEQGNLALPMALAMVPMMGTLGAGVDFMRASSLTQELQSALDSGVLSAANLSNGGDAEIILQEFVDTNLSEYKNFRDSVSVNLTKKEVALNSRTIAANATGTINTYFLGMFGIDELHVDVNSAATQSITNVEISLVMDISSSMRGSKLTNLKSAASGFVDQMLSGDAHPYTSISLVPFGGTVNIGSALFDEFVVEMSDAEPNPSEDDYDIGSSLLDGKFRFPGHGDNCLEYTHNDFDESVLHDDGYTQVPHFWKWNRFNPWCPLANSAAVFNTNNTEALKTHINGMSMSDGTGMDIGAMWGLKALSPNWAGKLGGDFEARPAVYDEETLKILVVMTDGGITPQYRPEDYRKYSTHTNRDEGTAADGFGGGNSGNNKNQQTVVSKGGVNTLPTEKKAVGYFKKSCDAAKTSGAIVYTIGFKINENSLPDQMLKYCASDLSKYYHVETLDLESAFNSIAASVNALRVTE
ncbi:TadE/TadG family type IV pilus assembly protein [Hirschia maritima]|uniref:TadE/TadG family type IV pilus assembly protein n=1 Tax=Hirschia maritima TaxID=1121961 RepID=UPI00035ECFF2|nr:TadE/TadG family type IV pilus assembly protein [Hirschia maritima]